MAIKILVIGDIGSFAEVLNKHSKKITIKIIHFPNPYNKIFINNKNDEYFRSLNILESVKKINEIKEGFDLCLVTSWAGARIAYLSDINYIIYFVGTDIQFPPFIKKSEFKEMKLSKFNHNFLERWFYKKVLDNAIACTTGSQDLFNSLKKYRNDSIRIDRTLLDPDLFTGKIEPLERKKEKFTFFSPQRFVYYKGIDLICESLNYCKTDFEILQVEWFDDTSQKGTEIINEILKDLPKQIKFIPVINKKNIIKYYQFADAVLGQMRTGVYSSVEREGAFCKKPVIFYSDPNKKYLIDGKEIVAPFLPHTNKPQEIAKIIDKVVQSKKFREELVEKEYQFINEICNLKKAINEWEKMFEVLLKKHHKVNRNSSLIVKKTRIILFIIGYISHFNKIKKKIKRFFLIGNF